MQDNGVRTQTIRLAEATPHPENYNEHDTAQVARLRGSLAAFGYVRRIVVQEHADGSGYTLVAGHGVAEALEASGYEEVEATVLPSDWSYEKVLAYLVADNELAKLAQSDNEQLARLLKHLEENAPELVEATGYDDERLNELLESIGFGAGNGSQGDAEPQADRAEELRQVWRTELGQLWQIGEHRLIVGDCTDRAVVERVMGGERAGLNFSDPPYGVGRDEGFEGFGGFGGFGPPIARRQYADDWDSERPGKEQFDSMIALAENSIFWGGNFFADILPKSTHWIVWDKNNTMPTFGDCELAWTSFARKSVKKYEVTYNGLIGKEKERFHPTQKPLKLYVDCLSDYSKAGQVVVDFYAGSGTTLVACQNLSRRCRAIEISPAYCAVILQRMADAVPGIDIRML